MKAGFENMPIPKENIFRMRAEDAIEANARAYEKLLKDTLRNRPLDLVMLGMGEDGHTASLFPHTQALSENNQLAVANEVPQKNTWRMTLTYPCINASRHIALYVLGSSKKYMVEKVLKGPEAPKEFPVQRVGTPTHKALWILDDAAAELIQKK